jgi:hypothetical protein
MREAFFNPVAVETQFIEQRRTSPPQIVHGERLKGQTVLLRLLDDQVRNPIKGGPGHGCVSIVA